MTICSFGAIHLDTLVHASRKILPETSTPATFSSRPGGVATNVARGLARLGADVMLAGALGADPDAETIRDHLAADGVTLLAIRRDNMPTGRYIAFHDPDGSLPAATVDGSITDALSASAFDDLLPKAAHARRWFLDANLPETLLMRLAEAAGDRFLAADAVSRAKASRLVPVLPRLDLLFCNRGEAEELSGIGRDTAPGDAGALAVALVARGVRACVLSDGSRPLAVATRSGCVFLDLPPVAVIRDVTGAGDALISGTLRGLDSGLPLEDAARCGLLAAALTLSSAGAAADALSWQAISPPAANDSGSDRSPLDRPLPTTL